MTFLADAPICPITQDQISRPVTLRGVTMEVAAVLDLLASGAPRNHPYDRKPLTPSEIAAVHAEALQHDDTRQILMERGWLDRIGEAPQATNSPGPTSSSAAGAPTTEQPQLVAPRANACNSYRFCGHVVVCVITIVVVNAIACNTSRCIF